MKIEARITAKEIKTFTSIVQEPYVSIMATGGAIVLYSTSLERKSFLFLYSLYNIEGRLLGKIRTKDLSNLAVDGMLTIEIVERNIRTTFTESNGSSVTVSDELQVPSLPDHEVYLDIDFSEYPRLNKKQLVTLAKVATATGLTLNVMEGEATIAPMNNDITKVGGQFVLRQKLDNPDMCILGYHLKKLLTFDDVYLVSDETLGGDQVIGITDNIFYILEQRNSSLSVTLEEVLEFAGDCLFETSMSFTPLAILAKKCDLKEGQCSVNLNTGICTYKDSISYEVKLPLGDFYDKTLNLPDWLLNKILLYYPEVLSSVQIKVFTRHLLISTEEFDMLLSLRR